MDASEYKFSDDEIIQLNEYRDLQPDARLKVRFIALLMMAEEVEPHKIALILKQNGLKFLKPKVVPGNPPTETEQKKLSNDISN